LNNVWSGLLASIGVEPGSKQDVVLQDKYVRGLQSKSKLDQWQEQAINIVNSEAGRELGTALASKLVELGMKAVFPS